MKLAFWISVGFVLYTYLGYPLTMYARSRWKLRPVRTAAIVPSVSIIMAVRNEEAHISRKLHNLKDLDYPPDRYEVIVISDGSTDDTNDILAAHAGEHVRTLISESHLGKAVALNKAIERAHGEIVVFTDARQLVGRDAIRNLVANFADPGVGCVSGELIIGEPEKEGSSSRQGVGLYWELEKKIRKWEGETGSVIGATGALYAVRRELIVPFPPDTILDDVYIPLHVVRSGRRVVFESKALAYDTMAPSSHEFRRKVRTLVGNYQLVQLDPWLITRSNPVLFQFLSHKLFRLWVPFALATILVSSWFAQGLFYHLVFFLQLVLYGLAGVSLFGINLGILKRIANVTFTVVMLNTAALVALVYFVTGGKAVWQPQRSVPRP
ncbi:MAG TPA: glycosyltransferase family 2 protein [Terriglobia bacterium]|nr:glycosyltransferase family 2 protein [Terriglobia bacterium]